MGRIFGRRSPEVKPAEKPETDSPQIGVNPVADTEQEQLQASSVADSQNGDGIADTVDNQRALEAVLPDDVSPVVDAALTSEVKPETASPQAGADVSNAGAGESAGPGWESVGLEQQAVQAGDVITNPGRSVMRVGGIVIAPAGGHTITDANLDDTKTMVKIEYMLTKGVLHRGAA